MPKFKIVELYPQADVRRVMVVEAPTLEEAKHEPHEHNILADEYDIEEGGEAVTEDAKELTDKEVEETLQDIFKMRMRVPFNGKDLYILVWHHEHGVDTIPFYWEGKIGPDPDYVAEALALNFEPSKGEYLDLAPYPVGRIRTLKSDI